MSLRPHRRLVGLILKERGDVRPDGETESRHAPTRPDEKIPKIQSLPTRKLKKRGRAVTPKSYPRRSFVSLCGLSRELRARDAGDKTYRLCLRLPARATRGFRGHAIDLAIHLGGNGDPRVAR